MGGGLVAFLLLSSVLASGLPAVEPARRRAAPSQVALRSRVQFAWEQTPFRDGVQRLGAGSGVSVFVDRRVDPDATVTLDMPPTPLEDCLEALAELQGCGASVLPHATYIGPAPTARELATLLALQQERVEQLPAEIRRRWSKPEALSWPRLSEPRKLVEDRAARLDIRVIAGESIPHDLWPATSLPDMPPLEQFVILLAGFHLAPEVALPSGDLRVVPMPAGLRVTRNYPRSSPRATRPDVEGDDSPDVTIEEARRQWTVTASIEFHRKFEEATRDQATPAPRRRSASPPDQATPRGEGDARAAQRFTLTVQNQPLGAILQTIARQTNLSVDWIADKDRWAPSRRSVSVQNATLPELLQELFRDLPIEGKVDGPSLRIDLRP